MNYYTDVIKRYVDFNGRARRKELWMFVLISFAITIVLVILDNILGLANEDRPGQGGLITALYNAAVLLPSLGVGVRRLHDTNRSGWWILLAFVPCIGLVVLYFFVLDGDAHPNEHGPDPKAAERGGLAPQAG